MVLWNFLAPESPQAKTLADLMEILKKHFDPKLIFMTKEFRFHQMNQAQGESVAVNSFISQSKFVTKSRDTKLNNDNSNTRSYNILPRLTIITHAVLVNS